MADVHLAPTAGNGHPALPRHGARRCCEEDLVDRAASSASAWTGSTSSAQFIAAWPRSGRRRSAVSTRTPSGRRRDSTRPSGRRMSRPRPRSDRARAGHGDRDGAHQSGAAHRQRRPCRAPASTRCADRTTSRARPTWAASRDTSPATCRSRTGAAAFERAWGAPCRARRGWTCMEMMDGRAGGTAAARCGRSATTSTSRIPTRRAPREALAVPGPARRPGPVPERDGARAGARVSARGGVVREGRDVHERRAADPARAPRDRSAGRRAPGLADPVRRRARHGQGRGFGFRSAEDDLERGAVVVAGGGRNHLRAARRRGAAMALPNRRPCGHRSLAREAFAHGPRATLRCVEPTSSPEVLTTEYPFVLITGRHLYQFNAGTMTGRTANSVLRPVTCWRCRLRTASGFGLQREIVGSRAATASRDSRSRWTPRAARRGLRDVPHPEAFVNRLTGRRGLITHTPEYKRTAVRIQAIRA